MRLMRYEKNSGFKLMAVYFGVERKACQMVVELLVLVKRLVQSVA